MLIFFLTYENYFIAQKRKKLFHNMIEISHFKLQVL
jgi:hypothetical protein